MPLDCSCDVITHAEYRNAARLLADHIRISKTFGASVGVLFRATHPERQKEPTELGIPVEIQRCQGCTPHIGRAIVEEGLRPQAEFDDWHRKFMASRTKCKDCPNVGKCGVTFDLSPF